MLLDLPFYPNTGDGKQCYQVAMQAVLKHFLEKDITCEELDRLTGRRAGFGTWTAQIVPVLHDLGLSVRFFSAQNQEDFLEGEAFIRRQYGSDADAILRIADIPAIQQGVQRLLATDLYDHTMLSWDDIQGALREGNVPLLLLNDTVLNGGAGPFRGHFIAVTGCDDDSVYYHESGPQEPTAHRKVPKQRFIDAWMHPSTDRDTVMVYGKKESF